MTGDYQTERRVGLKLAAIPFPDFAGKSVLDVGTDHAYWAFVAAKAGASRVLGLDRNREVRGQGLRNLVAQNEAIARSDAMLGACTFEKINLGKEWKQFGRFDIIFVMSVYHHLYENCGDHRAVWFWLSQHCDDGGELIFEGPIDDRDPVVRANVSDANRKAFTEQAILEAAGQYFDAEFIGPALHEEFRFVYRFKPKARTKRLTDAVMMSGAGGATKAFNYDSGRRICEIKAAVGFRPFPGSLNLRLEGPFDWDRGYFRSQILDVVDRSKGLDAEWAPRWMRFYPLTVDGVDAYALRFEGEKYDTKFMELIATEKLRDVIAGPRVEVSRG